MGTAFLMLGILSWEHLFQLDAWRLIINLSIAFSATPYGVYLIVDGIIAHKKSKN
jgi:hypothetical protein